MNSTEDSKYDICGDIQFKNFCSKKANNFNFYSLLQNGLELSFTFCLDFSKSIIDYKNSKIEKTKKKLFLYKKSIEKIYNMFKNYYTSNESIYSFGFGCIPIDKNSLSDIFPLNDNASNPKIFELEKILEKFENMSSLCQPSENKNLNFIFQQMFQMLQEDENLGEDKLLRIFFVFSDCDFDVEMLKTCFELLFDNSGYYYILVFVNIFEGDFSSFEILKNFFEENFLKGVILQAIYNEHDDIISGLEEFGRHIHEQVNSKKNRSLEPKITEFTMTGEEDIIDGSNEAKIKKKQIFKKKILKN